MDRRVSAIIAVSAMLLLAGCWAVPSDGGGNGEDEVIDHFSNPPDVDLRDSIEDTVGEGDMEKLSLVSLSARISGVTDAGEFVITDSDTETDPQPLWKVKIVGYQEMPMAVDAACRDAVADDARQMVERDLVGADAAVFMANAEETDEQGVRLYPMGENVPKGISARSYLAKQGYAVFTGGETLEAQEMAKEEGNGIWKCVDEE